MSRDSLNAASEQHYHHKMLSICSFAPEILTDVMAVEAYRNEADWRTEGGRDGLRD